MNFIEIGLSILSLIMSGVCTMLWQKINKIEDSAAKANTDLSEFKLYVAKEHPTQEHLTKAIDGFTQSVREVFGSLDGIRKDIKDMSDTFRDKLEQKADRSH